MSGRFDNLLAVCSFLGTSGYNYHARGFFTALNKFLPVGVENWSYDNNPYYLTNEQKTMLAASKGSSFSTGECITVVLHETNHIDWYNRTYKSPKIAFNVWESTRQSEKFFQKLLEFDQIWVPSQWQKECTIEQGAPEDKVFVVPEGIDTSRFKVSSPLVNFKFADKDKFTFTVVGRWEYRKATTEIIKTFNNTFKDENVELILLVDNPFDPQKMSTEDKLLKYGLRDKKIRILHKVSQDDYDLLIRETDCFVSASRAEGFNLPLAEYMACGIPVICTEWSGQMEFASKHANLVKIASMKKAWSEFGDFPGEYAEPDFDYLGGIMRAIYEDPGFYNLKALEGAEYLKTFTWENAARKALEIMEPLRIKKKAIVSVDKEQKEIPQILHDKKIKKKDIIVIDCFPNTEEKLDMLLKTIEYVKKFDKPIALVSHYPFSSKLQSLVDYCIFDADNTLPDYRLPVHYTFKSLKISGRLDRPYHSLPIIRSLQNVCKMFSNYERVHFIEYDVDLNFEKHLVNVAANEDKEIVGYLYEGSGIHTSIMTFKPSMLLEVLTANKFSWDDYRRMVSSSEERYLIFENWLYKILISAGKLDSVIVLKENTIDMKLDHFKQLPAYNFILSKTENNENILFIIHKGLKSSQFMLESRYKLVDSGEGYSYVLFDESTTKLDVWYKTATEVTFLHSLDLDKEPRGEFVFYKDNGIKCGNTDKSKRHDIVINNFFVDGAFVEILGPDISDKFMVTFTDRATGQVVHRAELGVNSWTRTHRKYYTDWNVKVICNKDVLYDQDISYFQKRVFIVIDSKAMGDTLAWFPMAEEFRKKHGARVIVASFWNKFFKDKYPEIEFIEPGTSISDIFAQFNIGCFDNDLKKNKFNWRITPLQKVAADILGISRKNEALPKISYKVMERPIKEKYVAISEHSTFMCKYWLNPTGWSDVIKYLNSIGYKVAVISKEATNLKDIVDLTGRSIEETLNNIHHADLFIGMSSGPSWLAWALKKPLVLISGYSAEWAEMDPKNPMVARIVNKEVCYGCFNDPSLPLERGEWKWCPRGRDFECSKLITSEMVIEGIDKFISSGDLS